MPRKKYRAGIFLFAMGLTLLPASMVSAAPQLVKGPTSSAVYYIDTLGVRHPFPNTLTYKSWYGSDFSRVTKISAADMARYPLGRNITLRPGKYVVKVPSSPQVYAVEDGGILRPVAHAEVLESWYGSNWFGRLVDIPEEFFGDYTVGKTISEEYDLPSGVLIKRPRSAAYYWYENNIIQSFDSIDAIQANSFSLSDALTTDKNLFARTRPITGVDATIFDPVAPAQQDTSDCENKKLKAAMVLVTNGTLPAGQGEIVEQIKQKIPETFAWSSDKLTSIDVDYPTIILRDDGYLLRPADNGSSEVNSEVLNTFFEEHPDQFDFVFVWTTFKIPTEQNGEIARFIPVTNRLGGTHHSMARAGEVYGSGGKLKGIILMGEIAKYHPQTPQGMNQALTYVMHELLHQWSGAVEFSVGATSSSETSSALLRQPDKKHWSYYAGFISPLGGSGWVDNKNGTFTSQLSSLPDGSLRKFSKLDLYLMGLIPAQLMEPIFYVEPQTPGAVGNTIAGTATWVSIDQIIEGNGPIQCVL